MLDADGTDHVPSLTTITERQTVWSSIQLAQRTVAAVLSVCTREDETPLPFDLVDAPRGMLHVEALVGTDALVTYSVMVVR